MGKSLLNQRKKRGGDYRGGEILSFFGYLVLLSLLSLFYLLSLLSLVLSLVFNLVLSLVL